MITQFGGNGHGVYADIGYVLACVLGNFHGVAYQNGFAMGHHGQKLIKRGAVHGQQKIGLLLGGVANEVHGTVGSAAAHGGTVGGNPSDFDALSGCDIGDDQTTGQNALPPEPANAIAFIAYLMLRVARVTPA
ncbi:hypothetical protein SDC9_40412 [bioreactor metagenome]|uniref:Uncharacterized protein n=1 Tax=bioreactor metagenome TaxID=1076179 RepID=A0A644VUX3_9ZZZZ